MKINTNKLKQTLEILNRAVGNNKLIPITSMIGIKTAHTDKNKIILCTTDATNYLMGFVEVENREQIDLDVTITFDTFYKLIAKTTKEFIEVRDEDRFLFIEANGKYKFDKLLTEDGQYYSFKFKSIDRQTPVTTYTIKRKDIEKIKKVNTSSLAQTLEVPAITGYYVGDKVISTDSFVMTQLNKSIIESPIILSSKVIEIISLFEQEELKLEINNNEIMISSLQFGLVSAVVDTVDKYPVADLEALMTNSAFKGTAKVNIKAVLETIDRLSLFVTAYDNQAINLNFTEDKLAITSKSTNGTELIELKEVNTENQESIICNINIDYLKKELSCIDAEEATVLYGNDNFVTFKTEEVTKYICTLEE